MNAIDTTHARNKRRSKRRGESLSNAVGAAIETTIQKLEETWRHAPQPVKPHSTASLLQLRTPLMAEAGCGKQDDLSALFDDRSGIVLASEGRKMGDESTEQGLERTEPRSGLIDEACSRFEAAWQQK